MSRSRGKSVSPASWERCDTADWKSIGNLRCIDLFDKAEMRPVRKSWKGRIGTDVTKNSVSFATNPSAIKSELKGDQANRPGRPCLPRTQPQEMCIKDALG